MSFFASAAPADLVSCRPEDRAIGAAHGLHFALGAEERKLLANSRLSVWFEVIYPSYHHASAPLSEEIRQSLLEDLALSDRD
jgi:hypothetical protein